MLIIFLLLLLIVMLIAILGILDSRFQSYLRDTRLGKNSKSVCAMALALSIIALTGVALVYKSACYNPRPASSDNSIYKQLVAQYENKGVHFSEQVSTRPPIRWVRGCSQDNSININIFSDEQLDHVQAYQVIVTASAVGELTTIIQNILPTWSDGPAWIEKSRDRAVISSTTYQDAYVEICANNEGPKKALISYYLGIYPHGYIDI